MSLHGKQAKKRYQQSIDKWIDKEGVETRESKRNEIHNLSRDGGAIRRKWGMKLIRKVKR